MTTDVVRRALLEAAEKSRGEDWYDRRLRERREAREAEERERQKREAKATKSWDAFHRAVDARIDEWARTKYNEVVATFTCEYFREKRKEFDSQINELKAQIAALERRLDARSSQAAKNFKFARDRGGAGKPGEKPTRMVQKIH